MQQRRVDVGRHAAAGAGGQVGEEHPVVEVGERHPLRHGGEPGEDGVGAGELPGVGRSRAHHQVGELGLADRHLSHRPLVVGQVGEAALGERVVAGGVVQPGVRVDAGDDAAQVDEVACRDTVDEHVQQREADLLRLERGVQVQHDPARSTGAGERDQLRQDVLAERAGHAAVRELQHAPFVAVAAAEAAVHDAGGDVAQVVVQHGNVRVEGADAADHGLRPGRGQPGEHEQLGSGHGFLLRRAGMFGRALALR